MTEITVKANSKDKASLMSAIAVLTLLAGGSTTSTKATGKAPPKGKGKAAPADESFDDGEFVDESEISNYNGGEDDNGSEDFDFDNDGGQAEEEDFSFVEEEEAPAKPANKGKAAPAKGNGKAEIKLDQLVVAFQALVAKKGGQEHAKKILDKYKVKSIRNLKKEDYEAVLAMATPKKK